MSDKEIVQTLSKLEKLPRSVAEDLLLEYVTEVDDIHSRKNMLLTQRLSSLEHSTGLLSYVLSCLMIYSLGLTAVVVVTLISIL